MDALGPVLVLLWLVGGGVVGGLIGEGKGRTTTGVWLGALFSFVGWLVVYLLPPTPEAEREKAVENAAVLRAALKPTVPDSPTRPCPWCAEDIKPAAKVCRYCGHDVEPVGEGA